MSAPTSSPAVVVVGPNSEFSVGDADSNRAPVASDELREQRRHEGRHRGSRSRRRSAAPRAAAGSPSPSRDALAQVRHRAHAVLDLREVTVVRRPRAACGRRGDTARPSRTPTVPALGDGRARPIARPRRGVATGVPGIHRLARVEVRELGEPHRDDGDRPARLPERPQVVERLLQHLAVVESRHHRPSGRGTRCRRRTSRRELRHDVRDARVVEQRPCGLPTASREPRRTAGDSRYSRMRSMSRSLRFESVAKLPYANDRR